MALTGTDRGSGNNNVAGTSLVITPASNFAAGSHAVLCVAYDNSGTNGADPFSSISDSVGNTWISRQAALFDPGAASAGVTLRIFTSPMLTAALTTSNTITVSFGTFSTTAKAWVLHQVSCAAGSIVRYVTGNVNTGATTGTPTVTTSSIASGDMVVGAGAAESADTWAGDADTTNGSWSAHQHNAGGTGTSGMSITSQRKITTGAGTQTYNPTLTSVDTILAWVQLTEVVSTLTAASTSYTLTGTSVSLSRGRTMTAASTSYTFIGTAAGIKATRILTAASVNYSLSGAIASLKSGRLLQASSSVYALSGQNASLLNNRKVAASQTSYNLSGTAVSLLKASKLIASQTNYSFSSNIATLLFGRKAIAGVSSYSLNGAASSLLFKRTLSANNGGYTLAGVNASLLAKKLLSAGAGVLVLTGSNVSLNYTSSGSLSTQIGAFVFTGSQAGLRVDRVIVCNGGNYQATGANANVLFGRLIQAADGQYSFTPIDVLFKGAGDKTLQADIMDLIFSGSVISMTRHRKPGRVRINSYITRGNKNFNKY